MRQRTIFFLLYVLTLCYEPAFAQAHFPFTGEVVADRVNVRAGQDNKFESIATVNKGTPLVVTGKSYSWYKVQLPEGARAFVSAGYVISPVEGIGEATADRLNVRAAPNTSATILGQIKKGKRFFIQETQPDWVWVKPVEEISGWVHQSLVMFKSKQISSLPSPDPDVLVAQKAREVKAEGSVQRFALLKKLDNGQVECSGELQKAEGDPASYRIVRDGVIVCFVKGPAAIMDNFVKSKVKVQGALEPQSAPSGDPVIGISKISLLL